MKLGVREICEVVFRAKTAQKIGNRVFYKNEPVIYFDTLKTSSLEGQSTTVYATGGRGNARLMGWDGERTVTFTMEDALISPEGMSILMGAGLVQGDELDHGVIVHTTERTDKWYFVNSSGAKIDNATASTTNVAGIAVTLTKFPYIPGLETKPTSSTATTQTNAVAAEDYVYIMAVEGDEIISEPYIPSEVKIELGEAAGLYKLICWKTEGEGKLSTAADFDSSVAEAQTRQNSFTNFFDPNTTTVLVDYYVAHKSEDAFEVTIRPDQFGCNFYIEASTLFRDTNGVDLPAEFVIPNAKVQSNFTFSMASSGDPSTFTFTMDAFPDYTRWDKKHKVIAALQVVKLGDTLADLTRPGTPHNNSDIKTYYDSNQKGYIEY